MCKDQARIKNFPILFLVDQNELSQITIKTLDWPNVLHCGQFFQKTGQKGRYYEFFEKFFTKKFWDITTVEHKSINSVQNLQDKTRKQKTGYLDRKRWHQWSLYVSNFLFAEAKQAIVTSICRMNFWSSNARKLKNQPYNKCAIKILNKQMKNFYLKLLQAIFTEVIERLTHQCHFTFESNSLFCAHFKIVPRDLTQPIIIIWIKNWSIWIIFTVDIFVPTFATKVTEYLCSGWVFFLQTNFDFLTSHFWRNFFTSFENYCSSAFIWKDFLPVIIFRKVMGVKRLPVWPIWDNYRAIYFALLTRNRRFNSSWKCSKLVQESLFAKLVD